MPSKAKDAAEKDKTPVLKGQEGTCIRIFVEFGHLRFTQKRCSCVTAEDKILEYMKKVWAC